MGRNVVRQDQRLAEVRFASVMLLALQEVRSHEKIASVASAIMQEVKTGRADWWMQVEGGKEGFGEKEGFGVTLRGFRRVWLGPPCRAEVAWLGKTGSVLAEPQLRYGMTSSGNQF